MVNENVKNPNGPTLDKLRRSSPFESNPHRSRKRSISAMLTTRNQSLSGEETEATRLLTRTLLLSKTAASPRHSESARLLKFVPDLTQKMGRLVGAIRQKRDASTIGRKPVAARDRPSPGTVRSFFFEDKSQTICIQTFRVDKPAR